jgi:hypothetical protein
MLSEAYGGEAVRKPSVSEWHERFKLGRISKSQMNTMLITFFDVKCTVHFEFIPQGQTVNGVCYVEVF